MNRAVFDFFSDLLRRESGMQLSPEKSYLLESRLLPLAQDHGVAGVEALAALVRRAPDNKALCQAVIEAMVTHESSFFRDVTPFDTLRDVVLPQILARQTEDKRIRIWSAACAGGQEVYSIAMLLKEISAQLSGWKVELLATDVSRDILRQAEKGSFTQFEVQRGLSVKLLVKYFQQEGESWKVSDDIKNMVSFRHVNLLFPPADLGRFDVIFCRNVLMYLETSARVRVLQNLHRVTKPHGALFLGGAESVSGLSQLFVPDAAEKNFFRPVQI